MDFAVDFGFIEILLQPRQHDPQSVLRAQQEGERFARHHEDLATYARNLVDRARRRSHGQDEPRNAGDVADPYERPRREAPEATSPGGRPASSSASSPPETPETPVARKSADGRVAADRRDSVERRVSIQEPADRRPTRRRSPSLGSEDGSRARRTSIDAVRPAPLAPLAAIPRFDAPGSARSCASNDGGEARLGRRGESALRRSGFFGRRDSARSVGSARPRRDSALSALADAPSHQLLIAPDVSRSDETYLENKAAALVERGRPRGIRPPVFGVRQEFF